MILTIVEVRLRQVRQVLQAVAVIPTIIGILLRHLHTPRRQTAVVVRQEVLPRLLRLILRHRAVAVHRTPRRQAVVRQEVLHHRRLLLHLQVIVGVAAGHHHLEVLPQEDNCNS